MGEVGLTRNMERQMDRVILLYTHLWPHPNFLCGGYTNMTIKMLLTCMHYFSHLYYISL